MPNYKAIKKPEPELVLNEFEKKWNQKIADCKREKATRATNWQLYKNLWDCTTPYQSEAEGEIKADIVVQIVRPQILSAMAKELMYVYGAGSNLTLKLEGKSGLEGTEEEKMESLEHRLQTVVKILINQSGRFKAFSTARQACYTYGNVMVKTIPHPTNKYKIFQNEVILPQQALFDTNFDRWENVGWAGHTKIVSKEYLLSNEVYIKKIVEGLTEKTVEGRTGIQISEIWDKKSKTFFTFAEDNYLIREPTKFPYNDYFPFVWASAYSEANTPWGFGLSEILKNTQFYASLLREFRIDNLFATVHNALIVPQSMRELLDAPEIVPGGRYPVSSMKEMPQPLFRGDITQGLDTEVQLLRNEALIESGFGPYAEGRAPTKRMQNTEVQALMQGSGRFWLTIKNSEDDFWIPIMSNIGRLIAEGPTDLFDKLVSPIDEIHNTEEYKAFGHLAPKDLKDYKVQIQATMADRIMNDDEKRRELSILLQLLGTIAPEYFKKGIGIRYILRTFRHLSGIEDFIKSDEEVEADREKMMERLRLQAQAQGQAQGRPFGETMRGGGGATAIETGGGYGR